MSRFIDHDKPYSQDDIDYLNTRSGGDYLIQVNHERFGSLSDEEKAEAVDLVDKAYAHDENEDREFQEELDAIPDFDDDVVDKVAPLTYKQLQQACSKLNLGANGTKEDLQDKLLNYYQDLKDSPAEQAKVETVLE